jgi:hypothetical protein
MSKALKLFVVLAGMSVLVAGCGASTAKTPKEAIKNLSKSIENSDKALFLASIYAGENGKEVAEAMFDGMAAMTSFSKAMEKAYGKEAGAEMRKDSPVMTEDEINKLDIKEEGDKATAKDPSKGKPMTLVKKNGVWLADMSEMVPKDAAERTKMIKMGQGMAKAIGEVKGKIGKSGVTKEQINKELNDAVGAVMKATMGG